ncbi:MAG: hypothetical protein M3Y56_16385, partial [Armatimonadota bacterium]|nr:hypothetical protein [Armatimonadota bacterium]
MSVFASLGLRDFKGQNGIRVRRDGGAETIGPLLQVDWYLMAVTVALCCFGLMSIYSATHLDPHTGMLSTVY